MPSAGRTISRGCLSFPEAFRRSSSDSYVISVFVRPGCSAKASSRAPDRSAVRVWPERKPRSRSQLTSSGRSALPVSAAAVATPTSAARPLLECRGSAIPKRTVPVAAASAMSAQDSRLPGTFLRSCRATSGVSPTTTGERMIDVLCTVGEGVAAGPAALILSRM